MVGRYITSLGFGVCVTFCLLFIMQSMVERRGLPEKPRAFAIKQFVLSLPEETIEHIDHEQIEPPEILDPPSVPRITMSSDEAQTITIPIGPPDFALPGATGGPGFATGDSDYVAVARVQPQYPPQAATRELEGYVIVQFTVTAAGTTRDIEVLDSSHAVFERSAVEAVSRFRYRPRVVGGEPVDVPGVRNRITFILD